MTEADAPTPAVPPEFRQFIVTDDFDRYGLRPGEPEPSPRYLQVELTDLCNLSCAGCVRAVHESTGSQLDLNTFTALLDQLPELQHVSFVGAGEALIVREFPAFVEACTRRGVFTSTNTNGLLVRRRLEPALDAGLGLIAISVDGADDTTLGLMRSGLRTTQLSAALRTAVSLVEGRKARLSAAVTLSATNVHGFADIVSFVADHGVREMTVESLHHWGDDKRLNSASLFALDPAEATAHLEEGLARASELGMRVSIFDYTRLQNPDARNAVCPWPWDACYITKDGDVTPCCVNMEAAPANLLGNIIQTPMQQIWRGEPFEALRRSFFDGPIWSSCSDCVYRMEFGRVL